MADENKAIGTDAVSYDDRARAVQQLLNNYPGLDDGEVVVFEALGENSGIGFSADSGAMVYSRSVCGDETCRFPFYLVYRATTTTERAKLNALAFLEGFADWLATVQDYPVLTGNRTITKIDVTGNPYATEPQENGAQDWVMPVTVEYMHQTVTW